MSIGTNHAKTPRCMHNDQTQERNNKKTLSNVVVVEL